MLQKLTKDWSSYDLTIYTDGLVKDGTETGGGGILFSTDRPSDPTNYHSNAMLTGKRCSYFLVEMKAMKKEVADNPTRAVIQESTIRLR